MNPQVHKRFLEYRERFVYFGRGGVVQLTPDAFVAADAEYAALVAKGDARDDEEEARYEELAALLYRD